MIFNTFSYYLIFLLPTAITFRLSTAALRPWVVATGGCLFFVKFAYAMAGPPGVLCLLVFLWEALVSRLYRANSPWCVLGLCQSIAFLTIFKYWNFLTGLALPVKSNPLFWRGAFLPLGISFFTFEFYHYAWDRYKDKTEAGSFGEYLAFILFFPTMVAGPIKRYQDFLPKLRAPPADWSTDFERGITRILAGLAKKFAIADLLTAMTNHLNRSDILTASRWSLPLWLVAFGVKIYIDFSAYSDIAIGSARIFSIRVPENFDWPYLQPNIAKFWAHWHISLTRWLTDYVFIPLGGSRAREPRVYLNILVTMLVSGLWHGAGLNFLVWGLWHAALLIVHRAWRKYRGEPSNRPTLRLASTVLTIAVVNAGWAFFCMDLPTALVFYKRVLGG